MPRTNRPPSYRLHRARNCAVVTIDGKNHYLGPFGSPESHEKYARLIAQWHACSGVHRADRADTIVAEAGDDMMVAELVLRYMEFATGYYRKHGRPTDEVNNVRSAVRALKHLYGYSRAADFGPEELELVRVEMIRAGLARKTINGRVGRIRRMFRWASKKGLVPPETYHGLTAVDGLKHHRSEARETNPVTTVPDDVVRKTLAHVNRHVAAMLQVQELAGMRPQDIRNIRTCDLDMTGDVWIYRPWTHKTEHHGHVRQIALGPRAQEVLRAFLKPDNFQAYVFSPREAVETVRAERARTRKTRRTPSELNKPRKDHPERRPKDQYTKNAYIRAVARACEKAGVALWSPNRLRHNCGTKVRRLFGLDAAAAVLGHRLGTVTEVYAEADLQKAVEVMRQIG